jgi:thiol-disulfide isomerase/thioredoxin
MMKRIFCVGKRYVFLLRHDILKHLQKPKQSSSGYDQLKNGCFYLVHQLSILNLVFYLLFFCATIIPIGSNAQVANLDSKSITQVLRQKNDAPKISYKKEFPFLINGNGGDGSTLIFHSILTGYQPGLSSLRMFGHKVNNKSDSINGYRVSIINDMLINHFRYAHYHKDRIVNFNWQTTILELEDPTPFIFPYDKDEIQSWREKYTFSYEAITPYAGGIELLYETYQNDLKRFFPQYDARVERRVRDCLVLVRTSENDKIGTQNGQSMIKSDFGYFHMSNNYLNRLIQRLGVYYMQKIPYPIVDGTGYTGRVDLKIDARLNDVDEVNRELAKYDLKFVVQPREIDVLIIRDSQKDKLNFGMKSVSLKDEIFQNIRGNSSIKLNIGEMLPPLQFTHILGYPDSIVHTNDFHGKLVLFDFWATWCTPCVAMMPELDKIQQKFNGELQIVSVTYEPYEHVYSFLQRNFDDAPLSLLKITNEKILHQLFPHTTLPHFVWVGPSGEVLAFTGAEEITEEKIQMVLEKLNSSK